MALVRYSQQEEYDLIHDAQDIRDWEVTDEGGNSLGKVEDMIVDTETEYVTAVILADGREVPVGEIAITDDHVIVRGNAGAAQAKPTTQKSAAGHTNAGEVKLSVVEEQLRVGKRAVERGGVRVRQTVTERPVEETVHLREEHVNVERRPVNRAVTAADTAAMAGGTIEMTAMAEEAVVGKQARVVEEVIVNKEIVEHDETIRDTVRRTDVDVQELDTQALKGKGKGAR